MSSATGSRSKCSCTTPAATKSALATALIELAERHKVPWVICHEPRYIDNDSRLVHDVLTALRYNTTIDDALARGLLHPNGEWRLASPEEMAERWKGREAGLEESERIASECDFNLAWVRPPLPKFPVPAGFNDDTFLRDRVFAGARERWGEIDDKQTAQLEHELRVIGNARLRRILSRDVGRGAISPARRESSARDVAAPRTPRSRTVSPSPPSIR